MGGVVFDNRNEERGGSRDEQGLVKNGLPENPFQTTIGSARKGSKSALGRLLEPCRNYLLLIANRELGDSIHAKIGASDLVQETFLQAQQILERFRGDVSARVAGVVDANSGAQAGAGGTPVCQHGDAGCRPRAAHRIDAR